MQPSKDFDSTRKIEKNLIEMQQEIIDQEMVSSSASFFTKKEEKESMKKRSKRETDDLEWGSQLYYAKEKALTSSSS